MQVPMITSFVYSGAVPCWEALTASFVTNSHHIPPSHSLTDVSYNRVMFKKKVVSILHTQFLDQRCSDLEESRLKGMPAFPLQAYGVILHSTGGQEQ